MINVRTIDQRGARQGYDLSDQISGLQYSNVRPGGDEAASFTYHAPWRTNLPEIAKGNILRISDGIDVLWQGRIEEADRGAEGSEQVTVSAFGLGQRLKDTENFRECYVHRMLTEWENVSVQKRINDLAFSYQDEGGAAVNDDTNGQPALELSLGSPWLVTALPKRAMQLDLGEGAAAPVIGSIYYAWMKNANINAADANWDWQITASADDTELSFDASGNLRAAGPGTGTLTPAGGNRRFAITRLLYNAANAANGVLYALWFTCLAVYGRHGLAKQGSESATQAKGFLASQMVADVVGRVAGMVARRIDPTTFVIEHMAFLDGVSHEDAVTQINAFETHRRTWGTWGPSSVLDTSTNGYFDYVAYDPSVADWIVFRSQCDGLDLQSELATLYDSVDVVYSDPSGSAHHVVRTRASADLNAAGVHRTMRLDGGTLTQAGAQALGDMILALNAGWAPARGSVTLSRPIRHATRGLLPPHYMRADGSNVSLRDILPTQTLFEISASPDRRTIFPIKRVNVDASGAVPVVRLELDQTSDLPAALQARLALAAGLVAGGGGLGAMAGGGSGGGGGGAPGGLTQAPVAPGGLTQAPVAPGGLTQAPVR